MVIAARPIASPAAKMLSRLMVEYSRRATGNDPLDQLCRPRRVPLQLKGPVLLRRWISTIVFRPTPWSPRAKKLRPVEQARRSLRPREPRAHISRYARDRACPQRQDLRSIRSEELTVVILFARDGKLDVGIYADDVRLDSCKSPQGRRCGGA